VLPVPTLPGVPMYRLARASAQAAPAAASARVRDAQAAPVKAAPPVKAIERARRAVGLSGQKPGADRLQAIFDGTPEPRAEDADGYIAIVEEVERPQTLPENDLLREIGVQ
ncbi:MAG: hypothetical protein KGL53_05545, partial [Elusimicrobia bacterium]|nr:hypothetical protein [Elusimicrobiota bacterium]